MKKLWFKAENVKEVLEGVRRDMSDDHLIIPVVPGTSLKVILLVRPG
jgi:hypothetical protein